MNRRIVRTILSKELLDTLRDRRTLVMMIGVPILLYPALTLIGFQVALMQHQTLEETSSRVALIQQVPGPMRAWIEVIPKVVIVDDTDPLRALSERRIDAVVSVNGDLAGGLAEKHPVEITIQYDVTEFASRDALQRVSGGLERVFDTIQAQRLEEVHLKKEFIRPFNVERRNVASPTKTAGSLIGSMLPLFMLITLALGAFYPAVDLTAGEKERGTFETLLATPASKLEIVAGKFGAVFTLAMSTCVLNLASMVLTFVFIFSQISTDLQERVGFQLELPLYHLPLILAVMIPMAFFVSAVMMSLAVMARNFKEAQNFVTPFFLLITLPAFVSAFPGAKLEGIYQFIPITNVSLLFKELMVGQAGIQATFFVFSSTCVFALLALLAAAWLFQREEVILAEDRGLNIPMRRARPRRRASLTPAGGLAFFAVVMLLVFYAGSTAQHWHFLRGLLFTEWGLLLTSLLVVVWFARLNPRTALGLVRMPKRQFPGVLVLSFAWVPLSIQLFHWINWIFPVPDSFMEAMSGLFGETLQRHGLGMLLFAAAISPAICEELLFRGLLVSAFRRRLGVWTTVLAVGLLFGIFHMSIYRMLPTAITGFVLTYLMLRTGSIVAPMCAHAVLNMAYLLLSSDDIPVRLRSILDPVTLEQTGLPLWLTVVSIFAFAGGVALVELLRKNGEAVQNTSF